MKKFIFYLFIFFDKQNNYIYEKNIINFNKKIKKLYYSNLNNI